MFKPRDFPLAVLPTLMRDCPGIKLLSHLLKECFVLLHGVCLLAHLQDAAQYRAIAYQPLSMASFSQCSMLPG